MYYFTAKDCHAERSCGHNHRTPEAARRCLSALRRQSMPGAVVRVVRYHGNDSNGERGTQTNSQSF